MKSISRSKVLFEEAQCYLPGGVDSPVRAFKAVGGDPLFIQRGEGSHIFDVDGNEYVDYVGSWGPLILGHAYPSIVEAVKRVAGNGTSFGAPVEMEVTLAKMITDAMPSIEMIRFVNSGTEATMSALRLARAFTRREKIIKFEGCYHGHSDGLLARSGSGLATLGIPDSPGVPAGYAQNTLTAPYNDIQTVRNFFNAYPQEIAAVIVEPLAANMGVVPPVSGFLTELRKLTREHGALLIFDEVITGFRLAYGGAQSLFDVSPDLTCLGKIIGGGLPVGAYGGKREIMQMMAPIGPVYQAGTLSGNPLAMAAGIETVKALAKPGVYSSLEEKAAILENGIRKAAASSSMPLHVSRVASLMTVFFTGGPVTDYDSAKLSNTGLFNQFFHKLQDEGVYWPPSQFEAAFVSLAHSPEDLHLTINACEKAFKGLSVHPGSM